MKIMEQFKKEFKTKKTVEDMWKRFESDKPEEKISRTAVIQTLFSTGMEVTEIREALKAHGDDVQYNAVYNCIKNTFKGKIEKPGPKSVDLNEFLK